MQLGKTRLHLSLALVLAALGQPACFSLSAMAAGISPETAEVFVQTGNSLQITAARFSADGQWIASCDGLGSVVAWDAQSGRQYREVHRHTGMCQGVAFSPDGQKLISSGGPRSGNDLVVSRLIDGKALQTWSGHTGYVRDIVTTTDGLGAWSLGEQDGLMRWAWESAAPVRKLAVSLASDDPKIKLASSAMVLNRSQSHAFVARRDGSILRIDLRPDVDPALAARKIADGPEAISALALSPDDRLLAVSYGTLMGSSQRDVVVIDTTSGKETARFSGHTGNVFALAFSPDGRWLAAAAQLDTGAMLAGKLKEIRQQESIRIWRVSDRQQVADIRNRRNVYGTPFLHGSLDFAPASSSNTGEQRLVLALWDEAARVYEIAAASESTNALDVRLLHLLEGRGLAPRQLRASDSAKRLMVTDGRPRKAPAETFMNAATVRSEFGRDADWTEERIKRVETLYQGRGWLTQNQRASLWDLSTGRLEKIVSWHRAPVTDLGVDAQGQFVATAPLFPQTIMVAPLKTRIVREATADAEGQVSFKHFSYEPWEGPADEVFEPPTPSLSSMSAAAAKPPHHGAYSTDLVIQSPSQRWSVVAAVPIQDKKSEASSTMSPRLFVVERLADGRRQHRHDIATPGLVGAMTIAADERTLWVAGTTRGLVYNDDHEAWLQAIDLSDGTIIRSWQLAQGVTVDRLAAHPSGKQALTNGATGLTVWDKHEATRKYRIEASMDGRNLRALAISADGRQIVTADLAGWTTLWDWPTDAAPVKKWGRQLAQPSPTLLSFLSGARRIAAGAVDGSVRILAASQGDEIARMIRFDNDEWITMIPEGYFVASAEGDRWINVRMGGKVYGVDQFYDVFYRPDIVERRLAGLAIDSLITVTLADALRQPPPRVLLTLPTTGGLLAGQSIKAHIAIQGQQGGGIGEVRVLQNGKLIEVLNKTQTAAMPAPLVSKEKMARGEETVTRALRLAVQNQKAFNASTSAVQNFEADVAVDLVAGSNAITAMAFNGAGNLNSRPLTRNLDAGGSAEKPRVFLLAVGIDLFRRNDLAPNLEFAVKDARDFVATIKTRLGGDYREAETIERLLTNQSATRDGLQLAIEQLRRDVRPNDLLIWFVASHGTLDSSAKYGIVMHDWDGGFTSSSLFSTEQILEATRHIRAFNQLVVLDSCHAGGINSLVRGLYDARLTVLARNSGLHLFASASATEEAVDGYQGNGLFTHTLLAGLKSAAADQNGDRKLSIKELGDYARRETKRIARQIFSRNQVPLLMTFGKDINLHAVE